MLAMTLSVHIKIWKIIGRKLDINNYSGILPSPSSSSSEPTLSLFLSLSGGCGSGDDEAPLSGGVFGVRLQAAGNPGEEEV